MYLVQMTLGCEFCHEFPDALVEGALNHQIDYLKQGGQTAGHRELWRLLRRLFNDTDDTDELIDCPTDEMPPANAMICSNIIRDAFGIDIAVKRHPVTTVSFAL
jgi:hypothetical protein